MKLRDQLQSDHVVVGRGFRLLEDSERIAPGDETACVSLLISLEAHEGWIPVEAQQYGKTVTHCLEPDSDASERVFRRAVPWK